MFNAFVMIVAAALFLAIGCMVGIIHERDMRWKKELRARSLKVITHDLEPGAERQTALAISISPLEVTDVAAFSVTLRGVGLAGRGMWQIIALGPSVTRSWGDPVDAELGFRVIAHYSSFIILRIMGYADLLIRLRIDSLPDDMELDVSKLPCYIPGTDCQLELGEGGLSIVTEGAAIGSPKIVLYQRGSDSTWDAHELNRLLDIREPRIHHSIHERMTELDGLAEATLAELMAYIRDNRGRGPTMIVAVLAKYLGGDPQTAMRAVRTILRGARREEVREIMGIEWTGRRKRASKPTEVVTPADDRASAAGS